MCQPRLVKQEDLEPELVAALTDHLEQEHPGAKVVFAGDEESLPPEAQEAIAALNTSLAGSFVEGRCAECGKQLPIPWPPEGDEDFDLPDGWSMYGNEQAEIPFFFVCGECESESSE